MKHEKVGNTRKNNNMNYLLLFAMHAPYFFGNVTIHGMVLDFIVTKTASIDFPTALRYKLALALIVLAS